MRNLNLKIPLLVLICGIAGASAASAGSAEADVLSTRVKYDPVALNSDAGARALYRRLVQAAEAVCPQGTDPHFLTRSVRDCREQAVSRAVFQINHPKLVAVYTKDFRHG